METKFETGATTHAVNDLILYADNTRKLAQMRDDIYRQAEPGYPVGDMYKYHGEKDGSQALKRAFRLLFDAAREHYESEMPDAAQHIQDMTIEQRDEFCQLYVDDFPVWKEEHNQ